MENSEQLFSLLTSDDPNNMELGKLLIKSAGISEKTFFEMLQLDRFELTNCKLLKRALHKGLRVINTELHDLSPLRRLGSLNRLGLVNCRIKRIDELQHLVNLSNLDLSNNDLEDISPLRSLSKLQQLHINLNPIKDVSSLANLHDLQHLSCVATHVSDYSGLEQLTNLRNLNVGCRVGVELSSLPANLWQLGIYRSPIGDLSALSAHNKLGNLTIHDCGLQTLANLPSLDKLQILYLNKNQLTSIAEGSNLPYLYSLQAVANQIKDLKGFRNSNLRELNLSQNPLDSLAGIEQVENLELLHITNTNIQDLSPLYKLKNLRRLFCDELPNKVITEFNKQQPRVNINIQKLQ